MIGQLDQLLAVRAPWLTSSPRRLYATMGLTTVNTLLS